MAEIERSGVSSRVGSIFDRIQQQYVIRNAAAGFRIIWSNPLSRLSFLFLFVLGVLAVIGPSIAPHEPDAYVTSPDGQLLRLAPPSLSHPLGTTGTAQDIYSRLLYGVRPTMIIGVLGSLIATGLGTAVGIVSGYERGIVDTILMRITDFTYTLPTIPFAIVVISFIEIGFYASIGIVGLILWRESARVIRSETLEIKERPYIESAKVSGAGTLRIMFKHVLPNIIPMVVLFFALGMGFTILTVAGLSFVGVTSPFIPTWGTMIRNAYESGQMTQAWWWTLPPGFLISLTVLATFLLGRTYESEVAEDNDSILEGGGM
jgi:peptide/nickel transport system permease protein